MEMLFKLLLLSLVSVLFGKSIEKSVPEIALLLALAVVLAGGGAVLVLGKEIVAVAKEIAALVNLSPELFSPLLKTLAIALTVRFGCAFCRDASRESLAAILETAGTMSALLAALPLLRAVVGILEGFL